MMFDYVEEKWADEDATRSRVVCVIGLDNFQVTLRERKTMFDFEIPARVQQEEHYPPTISIMIVLSSQASSIDPWGTAIIH